jgi:hypothetical protein
VLGQEPRQQVADFAIVIDDEQVRRAFHIDSSHSVQA